MRYALWEKYDLLRNTLEQTNNAAIFYSGGIDSTFLLYCTQKALGSRCMAFTANICLYPESQRVFAEETVRLWDVKHMVYELDILKNKSIYNNSADRCYHCKSAIYSKLTEQATKLGFTVFWDGMNFDERIQGEASIMPSVEYNVKSPLMDAGLTKKEIRELSKQLEIPGWDRQPHSCLATQVPLNVPLTAEVLQKVQQENDARIARAALDETARQNKLSASKSFITANAMRMH